MSTEALPNTNKKNLELINAQNNQALVPYVLGYQDSLMTQSGVVAINTPVKERRARFSTGFDLLKFCFLFCFRFVVVVVVFGKGRFFSLFSVKAGQKPLCSSNSTSLNCG